MMNSRLNKSNSNLLDLSLNGSSMNNSSTSKKSFNSRPTSASSNRSYILPKSGKSSNRTTPVNSARNTKPPLSNHGKNNDFMKTSVKNGLSRKSNVFQQLTARSSTEDIQTLTQNSIQSDKENDSYSSCTSDLKRSEIKSKANEVTPSLMLYKDSLDINNSITTQDEMLIYEKYLKDDFEMHRAPTRNTLINSLASTASSKIEQLKSSVDNLRRNLNDEYKLATHQHERLAEIRRKIATRKIQRWYRRHSLRRKTAEAALKRLMQQKKDELLNREKREQDEKLKKELEDKRKKEEKASQLRQKRISDYHKKKEENQVPASAAVIESKQIPKASVSKSHHVSSNTNRSVVKSEKFNENPANVQETLKNDATPSESYVSDMKADVLSTSTKSKTIDDLLEKLKELEKEEKFAAKVTKSEISVRSSSETIVDSEQANKIPKKNQILNDVTKAASLTTQKLDSILSFLDDVDTENNQTKTKIKQITKLSRKALINNYVEVPQVPSAEEIENLEEASKAAAEVTNTVLSQRLELDEKKRTIAMLQKALNQQRELTIRHTKEAECELQSRLEMQKHEYEATVQRHLEFIDQLIDDKKMLSEKCEKLVKELKDVEKKYSDKLKHTEETFKFETQKLKDIMEASERLRREKWMNEKERQIKEMTIKGMQPELQHILNKHKQEMHQLKEHHKVELLQADERASQKYIRMTEELRMNFEKEIEISVQKERELAKTRFEKCLEEEEKSFMELRRRLHAEVEEEKNRIAEQGAKQRVELDRLRKNLEENNLNAIEAMKREYESARQEQERRHLNEIKELKQRLEIEKQTWEENYIKRQENAMAQKERELRELVKKDRDREIELVIQRLESESSLTTEETERAAENKVKRIRDKYEGELREVEKSERETTERYNSLKGKYNELEGDHERLKVALRQKERELLDVNKITETLQSERSRLADIIRQEFSDRLVFTDEENKRLKLDMAELRSKHQYDLEKKKEEFEKMRREKDDEVGKLTERVVQAIKGKDENISELRRENEVLHKRSEHLEELLGQQRKLIAVNNKK